MTIGMPFSGKSTLAETYQNKEGWRVVSRDELLPTITSSPEWHRRVLCACKDQGIDPSRLKDTFEIRNRITLELLNDAISHIIQTSNENIFYDGTNIQKNGREMLLKLRSPDLEVHGVYFNVPDQELMERATKAQERGERNGAYNADAFKRMELMRSMFQEPSLDEGFDSLIQYRDIHEHTQEMNREFKTPLR